MYLEPNLSGDRRGCIEVICGSMFSGKTEELIRRMKRAKIANLRTESFKPSADVRFSEKDVVSHDDSRIQSIPVENSHQILLLVQDAQVVAIDEAQFFDEGICEVCEQLAMKGIRVIVAGLDMDFEGNPFGPMPQLLAIADFITKLHAICVKCGNLASISYRKVKDKGQFLLGEKDLYEPRCRYCAMENK